MVATSTSTIPVTILTGYLGTVELIATLDNAPKWIDKLAWSPTYNHSI